MAKYIAKRALRSLITVALVFVAVFMLLRFMIHSHFRERDPRLP